MALTRPDQLPAHLGVSRQEIEDVSAEFPLRISPHYLGLIRTNGDPIAKQVIPNPRELEDHNTDPDPLNEEVQAPVRQIIHRYPHRVVFLVSNQCPVYCRFCMRKRRTAHGAQVEAHALNEGIDYIGRNRDINEVILSGGDPLMLSDGALIDILGKLRRIPHVRILRLHTRIPSAWPQRITPDLAAALSKFHPLFINIHYNHPAELSKEAWQACALLGDAGIALGSQTVLLRGVNDHVATLSNLFQTLLEMRVRPYYLHQLDRVPGTAHFQVPMEKALGLMDGLRGTLSGLAMPHFMVDLPGGGGKVELLPDVCLSRSASQWTLKNYQGHSFSYPIT